MTKTTAVTVVQTKQEAINQTLAVDKFLADVISETLALEDEAKMLKRKIRESKEAQRLKEINSRRRILKIHQHEGNGQRKLIYKFLEKLGVTPPETKLTKLAVKDPQVKQLAEA